MEQLTYREALKLLDLSKPPTDKELRKAYIKAASVFHPDSHPEVSLEKKREYGQLMAHINMAKDIVSKGPQAVNKKTYQDYLSEFDGRLQSFLSDYKHNVMRKPFIEGIEEEEQKREEEKELIIDTWNKIKKDFPKNVKKIIPYIKYKIYKGSKYIPIAVTPKDRKQHRRWVYLSFAILSGILMGIYVYDKSQRAYVKVEKITWRGPDGIRQ